HPLLQQNDLLSNCHASGIQLTAYAPLGATSDTRPPLVLQHPVGVAIAADRQISPAQELQAWGIGCGTAVIPQSVHPERLADYLAAAAIGLNQDQMARLVAIDGGQRLIDGRFWCLEGGPYSMANLWDGET
ncbi:MAG: aldo/keto reductase, partial [Cyanobacteriota bacterium]